MDLSWCMRMLNESIAREANREDRSTGRFWEGRFKSQALLGGRALAGACLTYFDLNPIRAKMTESVETSVHTSLQQRIEASGNRGHYFRLLPPRKPMPAGLPFRLQDYLELVDWTKRCLREDHPEQLPPILDRLQIDPLYWLYISRNFESRFKKLVGSAHALRRACAQLGKHWAQGIRDRERYFSPPTPLTLCFFFKERLRRLTARIYCVSAMLVRAAAQHLPASAAQSPSP